MHLGRPWRSRPTRDSASIGRTVDAARTRLGAEAFQAAWAAGRELRPDQAVAEASAKAAEFAMPRAVGPSAALRRVSARSWACS